MFGIKKKGREKSAKLHTAIQAHLFHIIQKYAERFKIQQKIRIANIWSRKHPKKLMVNYVTFAVLLLGITLMTDFPLCTTNNDTINLASIPSMSPRSQS